MNQVRLSTPGCTTLYGRVFGYPSMDFVFRWHMERTYIGAVLRRINSTNSIILIDVLRTTNCDKHVLRNTLWERRCEKDVVRKTLWERRCKNDIVRKTILRWIFLWCSSFLFSMFFFPISTVVEVAEDLISVTDLLMFIMQWSEWNIAEQAVSHCPWTVLL